MTVEEAIKNFVNENNQYELYENYSGRCMFGRTCLGVIVQQNDSFMDFIIKLTKYLAFTLTIQKILQLSCHM